jgi:hypothetical protein
VDAVVDCELWGIGGDAHEGVGTGERGEVAGAGPGEWSQARALDVEAAEGGPERFARIGRSW